MRLIAARLERVRQHRLLELRFAPGFTLIAGANEAGKSTVVEALHKALFLKATASGRGVEDLRSLTHGGLPEVELRFEAAGGQWLLRKRFAGSGGTCQLSSSGGATLLGQEAETQLAALLQVNGPVEGRRIAQLPLRWAHLWVRQGEAGSDPLAGGGEAYDLSRLVQQLQRGSGSSDALEATATALESPLDRQVQQRLQQELDLQFTATGKVRAGSPLAQAQQRESEARTSLSLAEQRLAELEAAMAELGQINTRLEAIEQQERPALLAQAQLRSQLQLLQAEAEPLQQRHQQLQAARQQLHAIQQQQQADERQHQTLQEQLSKLQLQHTQLSQSMAALQQQRTALEQQQHGLLHQQEVLGAQRDLAALERAEAQLRSHKSQFDDLQRQANTIKLQLQSLPAVTPEQVRQLRQAEQQLAQAQARAQGMATRVTLLQSDQRIELDGQGLAPGHDQLLEQAAVLQVGAGTRIAISPGGGTAMDAAREQRQQADTRLNALQRQLGLNSSDTAEALAQQRQALEGELTNLRKAAQAIPWAKLDAQLAELEPRRQRLMQALLTLGASTVPSADLAALEASQDALKLQSQQLSQQRNPIELQLKQQQQQLELLVQQQAQRQSESSRLAGGLSAAQRQRDQLHQLHGTAEEMACRDDQLSAQLLASTSRIERLQQQLGAAAEASVDSRLQQLEREKDLLLTRRGQQEQLCRSLGARDPVAEVEQLQAAWEQAQSERERITQRTAALQLLLDAFHAAQQESAGRYCQPLQTALQGYLEALQLPHAGPARLAYDPQQGFADLQLQQGNQAFDFAQLSGGMREQLAGALRLALADVLQGAYDGCLPLVFDDAFSNSDPLRRSGVLRMLQRAVARGLQIVMFSCTPDDFAPLAQEPGLRLEIGP